MNFTEVVKQRRSVNFFDSERNVLPEILEKAIELAWDLLVNGYKLPADKLWVSIFFDDDEAYNIWRNRITAA